jgi:transketolase
LIPEFKLLAKKAKARLIRMHYENKIGHIGGNLSCLDAMLFLHLVQMKDDDAFVLSKGHAAGALYISLWMQGKISEEELLSFHKDGSLLSGHPAPQWHPGIRFATGSLGHGLGLAAGVALARKLEKKPGRVYCLLSDGEWQEGSNWESAIFIKHHRLDNLSLLIDANGLQGFGSTAEVASQGPESLARSLESLGLEVRTLDGHDPAALEEALARPAAGPLALVLRTTKGKGVSFMENAMEWHYLPMDAGQYAQAMREIA